MNKKLLLLILVTSSIKSVCQNDGKAFYGKIHDALGSLSNAHIINTNTQKATYSNENGEFRIFVQVNDSLKFTSVGYKTHFLIIKPIHLGMNETKIILKKEIYELDEIEIKKHNLSGLLTSDIKQVKKYLYIDAKTLQLPNAHNRKLTVAERRLYTAKGSNLDYIINTLNGKIRKLKEEKKNENKEREITYLKEHFKNYLLNDLKIDSHKINLFISYFQADENYNQEKEKGEFYLIDFIRKKSVEFNKTITP